MSSLSDVIHHERDTVTGAGKSTEAKRIVGEGIIHSTDTLIEEVGDYNEFFDMMRESGNWSALTKMHNKNLANVIESIKAGITRIIVDNTNIKASEPKKYVEHALRLGIKKENIIIVDVGDNGYTASELFERNTHNVPLEKIKQMINAHRSVGELTVDKILKAKNMQKENNFTYVKLDNKSKIKLMTVFGHKIPKGWTIHSHHMTISFGKPTPSEVKNDIGKIVSLKVETIGKSDVAIAVGVSGYYTTNKIAHITLGVSPDGKAVMSNDITKWVKLDSYINLTGTVMETAPITTPTTIKI